MRCFAVLLNTHKNFIQTYFEINFARPRRCVDVVVVEVVCVVVCCCCFRVQYEGITRVTLTRFGRLVIAPVFADRCVPTFLPTYPPSYLQQENLSLISRIAFSAKKQVGISNVTQKRLTNANFNGLIAQLLVN